MRRGRVRWRVLVGGGDRVTTVCKGQPLPTLLSSLHSLLLYAIYFVLSGYQRQLYVPFLRLCMLLPHASNGVTLCLPLIISSLSVRGLCLGFSSFSQEPQWLLFTLSPSHRFFFFFFFLTAYITAFPLPPKPFPFLSLFQT
ncbi:hypothetical protein VNO80_19008 [Phaseolus coccineus]|uniref:Uncharacterized protein n=1 Tax=Phaseolus coccineus TaxID=3886 RepID=A0AAN9MLE2_PHACN